MDAAVGIGEHLPCGTTITSSTTLTANVNCTSDTTDNAIIVGAPGITVNLNGHKILGPGAGAGTEGIADYSTDSAGASYGDVTVEDGTISNFLVDVDIEGSSGSDLTGVIVDNVTTTNNSPGEGYAVHGEYLDGASIHSISMSDPSYGVYLESSESSAVSDSEVVRPSSAGFEDSEGAGNTWAHNSGSAATYDGFYLYATTDTTVDFNTVSGTTGATGVYDDESIGVAISKNAWNHLYDGLQEYASSGMVNNNKGSDNTWGIYSDSVNDMTYLQNRFANGQYGIETDFPYVETLQGNTTNHNSEAGVFIYSDEEISPDAPMVKNNTANDNRYGLYSQISTTGNGNDATGNTVVNCYNVHCGSGGPRAGSVTAPVHRTPGAIQRPGARGAKF